MSCGTLRPRAPVVSEQIEVSVSLLRAILRETLSERATQQILRRLRGERMDLDRAAAKAEEISGPVDETTRAAVRRLRRKYG